MKTISIHDAKTNLSQYISAAKEGERVYIGGFGKAEVVLTKIEPSDAINVRDFTAAKGKIVDSGDAFSLETEAQIATMMVGD